VDVSDGTPAGTRLLKDILPRTGHSNPQGFVACRDRLYFQALDGLWSTDGTTSGTRLVVRTHNGKVRNLTVLGDRLLFITPYNYQVAVTDGTTSGTRYLTATNASAARGPNYAGPMVGGKVYFATSVGLYLLDVGATSHVVATGCDRHDGPRLTSGDPVLGAVFTARVQARPNTNGFVWLGTRARASGLHDIGGGCYGYLDLGAGLIPIGLRTNSTGSWHWRANVPRTPALNGVRLAMQSATAGGGGFRVSDLLVLRLGW
jgi:ELWxxDGT repeat protein